MIVKSIDTEWKGFLFRSRLEARWAMFFDACGADWEYEPEGFELDNGLRYLPDFRIRNVRICHGIDMIIPELFIEVKGVMGELDAKKIKAFCDYNHPDGISTYDVYPYSTPIFVVKNIPAGTNIFDIILYMHVRLKVYDMEEKGIPFFNYYFIDGDWFWGMPGVDKKGNFAIFGCVPDYIDFVDEEQTMTAYNKARQARFW